jgi:hypothetical protein
MQKLGKTRFSLTLNLNQDLGFITKGLSFFGRFGYDTNDSEYNQHSQWPEQWTADNNRDDNGNIVFTKVCDQHLMTLTSHSYGQRMETLEAELHYNRIFGSHTVGAVAKYTIDRTVNTSENTSGDYIQNIDYRHQGMAGQITYGFKERYFADFNFGYNGSENFARHHQYGFFPAFSVAWNIGEEPWIQKNLPWMNMLKVRFSDGKVGNDNLGDYPFSVSVYIPVIKKLQLSVSGYHAGFYKQYVLSGTYLRQDFVSLYNLGDGA